MFTFNSRKGALCKVHRAVAVGSGLKPFLVRLFVCFVDTLLAERFSTDITHRQACALSLRPFIQQRKDYC